MTVNKAELAHILRVSLPTLTRWILKYGPDFPVLERGTNGRDYAFDASAVSAFLRAQQEAQAASREEKDEQLAQLRLSIDIPGVEAPPKATSPKEELDAWRLRRIQREEAVAAGALVPAASVRDAFRTVFARLSRDGQAFIRQVGREQRWPDPYIREMERRWGEQQRASVAGLASLFGPVAEESERVDQQHAV
ncbi:MAG: terminase small subunit [Proteobacteria bacterium]|nr:terminase small subunit [Pseudomonadota bacterium]